MEKPILLALTGCVILIHCSPSLTTENNTLWSFSGYRNGYIVAHFGCRKKKPSIHIKWCIVAHCRKLYIVAHYRYIETSHCISTRPEMATLWLIFICSIGYLVATLCTERIHCSSSSFLFYKMTICNSSPPPKRKVTLRLIGIFKFVFRISFWFSLVF